MALEKFYNLDQLKNTYNDASGARNAIVLTPGTGSKILLLKLEGSADAAGDLDIESGVLVGAGLGDTLESGTATSNIGGGTAEQHGVVADTVTGATSATVAIASAATWQTDTVSPGDIVTNATDGSTAVVVSVDSETQLTSTALTGGTLDVYTATDSLTITPGGVTLIDTSETFVTDGVLVGDQVRNTTDGSDGVITALTETIITVGAGLAGGTDDLFENTDTYTVHSANILADTAATFVALDVQVGDTVTNTVTANSALVLSIDSDTQITMAPITGWWTTTDTYTVKSAYEYAATGGKTLGAAIGLNEDYLLPIAGSFKIVLTAGGRMSVTYKETS